MAAITGIRVVIIGRVTQLALLICFTMVQWEGMFETGWFPGISIMAHRTLPAEVVVWPVARMAGNAVCCTSSLMNEVGRFPGIGVVAS